MVYRAPSKSPVRYSGLTLIELLVVVAIVAIVMSMGAPTMNQVAANGQATESINNLIASLRSARSEAIVAYQDDVIVCPSRNGTRCNSTDWSDGWIVFVDTNGNKNNDLADRLIRVVTDQPDTLQVRGLDMQNNPIQNNRLEFDSEGMLSSEFTFTICDDRGRDEARAVVINRSGQARIATDDNGDGMVDIPSGNLNCNA